MSIELSILFWLAIKHGVCDLALQAIYCRPSNKHIWLSPKAALHSLHHGVGTFVVLIFFTSFMTALSLAVLDLALHHHIDHIKSSIVRKYKWGMDGIWYWVATTVDQHLHFATYLLIVLLTQV
jgi:hypothetical protein